MDSKQDFIHPALIHYLFFRQKNLIIFPYVDLKHLIEGLEPYSVGHNLIDLDMTAIFDLELVLGSQDSYTERPNMYILYNCSKKQLKQILKMENLRCIININKKIEQDFINGYNYILYNKKQKKLLTDLCSNLEYEKELIKNSEKIITLHNELQKIFIEATSIFECISQGEERKVLDSLSKYPNSIRKKLLDFIELYFKIIVPKKENLLLSVPEKPIKKSFRDKKKTKGRSITNSSESKAQFLKEYNRIVEHANIGREFIQLLHNYKANHVNQSNLDIDQLINPSKLYSYLRMHHWKKEIPPEFIKDWVQMKNTQGNLEEETKLELKELLRNLNIPITDELKDILREKRFHEELPEKNAKPEKWLQKSQAPVPLTEKKKQALLAKDSGIRKTHQNLIRKNSQRPPISDYTAYKKYVDDLIRDVRLLMERTLDKFSN
jgi:hypothetical protein